jgi:asparagine synthase (glutamine-hydrolysing)
MNLELILKKYLNLFNDNSIDKLKLARYIDMQTSLEGDMLVKVDRASMLCSLECRAPFLDHKLMEYTYQLPDNFLIKGSNKKRILKETFEDLLPENFFNSPKQGFEIPIGSWLRNELKADLLNTLSKKHLELHGFFQIDYVNKIVHEHINESIDHAAQLWTLFCFQKWYNNNIKSIPQEINNSHVN